LLARRLTALPEPVHAWLAALAVSPRPSPALSERLEAHLGDAVAAGIVETDRRGQLRFVHPLLVAAANGLVSDARRRAIHRRLAELADDPEQRAAQLALGAERPDPEVAAALDRAAVQAHRRGAPAAAAELAEQAARLTPPADDGNCRARRRTAAVYHVQAGDGPRARTLLTGLIDEQAPGPERARNLLELASISEQTTQAIAIARRAVTEAGSDRALLASIHQLLGSAFGMTGDLDRWERHVTLAARLADATSPSLAAGAMSECALVRFLRGGGVQRELGIRAAALARAAPDGASITTPLLDAELNLAIQLLIAGELDEARTLILARRSRGRDGDAVSQSAVTAEASWCSYLLTELELRAGRWSLADQHAQSAAAADASRAGNLQTSTLLARALVDAHLGRVEHAREAAAAGLKVARAGGELLFVWLHEAVLGFIALSLEDPLTAHRHLGPVVRTLHRQGFVEPALPAAAPDEIEALIALGELDAARTMLEELQRTGERLQRRWALAAAHRGRALLASATGDHESAIAAADAAIDAHRQFADPFGRARTLLARGAILGRAGRRHEAHATLDQARALFTHLEAGLWVVRADRETHRLNNRTPAVKHQARRDDDPKAQIPTASRAHEDHTPELFITRPASSDATP
jgi:tetratricopeptide (TPR) repeat protein